MTAAGFPLNTVLFICVTMFVTAVLAWLVLRAGLAQQPGGGRWQVASATVLGVWFLVSLVMAIAPPNGQVQFIPYSVIVLGIGVTLGTAAFVLSPTFRRGVRAIPAHWLIGIQGIRVGGFIFVALLDMGRLPAQFALPAGYGDMTVGALSLLAAYALVSQRSFARGLAIGVNVLGLLDFITALSTGLSALTPFAIELQRGGVSPLYLSYVLIIPSFAVPVFTLLHCYSLYQLALRPRDVGNVRQSAIPFQAAPSLHGR
jgi:hypothetical protein